MKEKIKQNLILTTAQRTKLKVVKLAVGFLMTLLCATVGFVVSQPAQEAQAAIPKVINFQGKLTAVSNGNNVANGSYAFEFKIYDALTSGTLLWTETFDQPSGSCGKLTVTNGVFNAKLGSCNSLSGVDFTGGSLYLTVNFDDGGGYDGEMSPRKQLVSSAFAFVANSVSGDGVVNNAVQSATALSTGRTSANPALQVDTNTASSVTGLKVTAAAAGGGLALTTISSGTNENITLDAKGSGSVSINGSATGDVLLAGGSSGTGCTVTNSSGDLTCTGSIIGAVTGTSGYWTRTGTVLSPATAGDDIELDSGDYIGLSSSIVRLVFNDAARDNVTLTAGDLLFSVDNTWDIGASGATRARTIYAGTSVVAPTLNGTTAVQLNGTDINTAGTLTNVAYENQANIFTLNQTIQKADPSIILDVSTATDTDFWLGVQDDAGGDDDDVFQIGDGTTPGTNPFLTINTTGNVGIGVTTPSAKLEVNSGAFAFPDSNQASASVALSSTPIDGEIRGGIANGGDNYGFLRLSAGGGVSTARQSAIDIQGYGGPGGADISDYIRMLTAGTERLRIINNGNIGFATTAPDKALEINSATGDNLRLTYNDNNGSATNYADLLMSSSGDLTITPSGGDTTVTGTLAVSGLGGGGTQCVNVNNSGVLGVTTCGASLTPWTSDIDADGFDLNDISNILFRETTGAPTGTDVGFYRDNSGDLSVNVLTGKTFNLAVNGTDEYNFSSTALGLNSNNITGVGTNITATGALTVSSTSAALTLSTTTSGNVVLDSAGGTIELQDSTNVTGNFDASGTLAAGTGNAFQVSSGGAVTAVGVDSGSGLIQGTGGLTITGATNINTSGSAAVNIGTGGSTSLVTIGGGSGTFSLQTTNIDISSAGAITNATGFNGLVVTANTGVITTGTWQGTAVADTYVADTLTIDSSSSVHWNALNNYPAACSAGSAISQLADTTNTCTAFNTDTSITLQDAYNATSGNTITTTTGRNIAITLAEVATPTSFTIENQDTAATSAQRIFNSIASGTATNGLLIEQTGAGTLTNAIQIAETSGTITDGILITGTLGNILNSGSIDITGAGAITGATGITSASGDITATTGNFVATAGGYLTGATTRISSTGVGTFTTGTVIGSQTFTTNNIADSGALTIASGSATALTLNSGTTGTINIGTDASAETINIGNTGAAVKTIAIGNNSQANTITIGDASATGVSITDNNWSVTTAGAATFATVNATTTISLGGADINTAGTLTNVAYLNQANAFTLNQTIQKTDPSLILNATTGSDTDYWLGVADDAGGTDNDLFQIGDGTTPGTNPFLTINTDGGIGIGSISPTTNKLYVENTFASNDTAVYGSNQRTSSTNYGGQFDAVGSGATSNTGLFAFALGGTTNYGLQAGSSGAHTSNLGAAFTASGATNNTILLLGTATPPSGNYALYSSSASDSYIQGKLGIGDVSPAAALTVGSGDLFQVNSSGAIAAATGVTSSGTITFSGLGGSGTKCLQTDNSGVISAAAAACGTGSLTPWTTDVDADGFDLQDLSNIEFRDTTGAPAGTVVAIFRDNTGDLNLNALTGKTTNIQVNGTDEYNFSSSALAMNGNNITGLGTALTAAAGLTLSSTSADLTLQTTTSGNIEINPANGSVVEIGAFVNYTFLLVNDSTQEIGLQGTGISYIGDHGGNGFSTYVEANDATQTITASGQLIVTDLAGGGTQCVNVDNTGLLGTTSCGGGLTVGSTAIASGGANRILFENGSNVLSENANFTYDGTTFTVAGNPTTGAQMALTNTGVYTGTGLFNLTANSATTGTLGLITSSSLTSGSLLSLTSSGTGALTNQKGLNVSLTGNNGTGSQTTYGGYFSNTHGGSGTNVALYATATSGTNNYAAIFDQGNVGIGDTSPLSLLTVGSGDLFQVASTGATTITSSQSATLGVTNTADAPGSFVATFTGTTGTNGTSGVLSTTKGFSQYIARSSTHTDRELRFQVYSDGVTYFGPATTSGTVDADLIIRTSADSGTNTGDITISPGGSALAYFMNGGVVGIGTAGADRKLDVLDASNPQLRLTTTDGSVYADLQNTATANLVISGDSLTSSSAKEYGLQITPTVNQTSSASYTGLEVSVTETGTTTLNGLNRLLDLRVAGSSGGSKFAVANNGNVMLQGSASLTSAYASIGSFQNILVQSQDFTTTWTTSSISSITANGQTAPDGSSTAESLATSGSGGYVQQDTSTAVGSTYTFSVWVKSTGAQNFGMRIDGTTTGTGTEVTHAATTQWQRFSVTQNTSGFTGNVRVRLYPGTSASTGTIYAWGAQLEASSTANAYAMTTTGALTNVNRGETLVSNFATQSGFTYGGRHIIGLEGAISASSTTVGEFIRVIDNATGTNDTATVRALEVQAYSGSNINGINTGIASYGYTFGVHAVSTAQANEAVQPAALFADLDNGSAPTQGNAIRAYSDNLTSADLVSFYQETSSFTGNGLEMNFGNNSGSFTGNFISLQKAGTESFHVDDDGSTFVSLTGTQNTTALCHATNGQTNNDEIVDCSGAPSDVAEYFGSTDSTLTAAEVVASGKDAEAFHLDGYHTSKAWIERATKGYQANIIGVISTSPAAVYGDEIFNASENPRPVALVGRVPVKVTTENGNIKAGDYLTSSASEPGKAMKATRSGMVIGQALSSYDGTGEAAVIVFVDPGFQSIGNTIVLDAPSLSGQNLQSGDEDLTNNAASTFVIQQQSAEGDDENGGAVSDILQLQSGDSNRFMVSSTGATSILSNLTCSEADEDTGAIDCPSVLKVTQANTELMNIDAHGNLTLAGTIFIKDDTFAGSIATDEEGKAEITFSYNLGTGKPVVQLTAEAQIPVFAQIIEFKQDEHGNYTGFVMKTFDLISGPVSAIVHYTVVGKQDGYITSGEVLGVQDSPDYNQYSGTGSGGSGDGSDYVGGEGVGLIIENGEVVGGDTSSNSTDSSVSSPDVSNQPTASGDSTSSGNLDETSLNGSLPSGSGS